MNALDVLEFFDTAPDGDVERAYRFVTRIVEARRATAAGPTPAEATKPRQSRGPRTRDDSIRALIPEILRADSRPLTVAELSERLGMRGKTATTESVRTVLSRLAKVGDTFAKWPDGKFGLVEWKSAGPLVDQASNAAQR